jgi:hypothetical protein
MEQFIEDFIKSFTWYRNLTIGIAQQVPHANLQDRISDRSLTLSVQIIDMGDFQIKVLEMMTGKKFADQLTRPNPTTATNEEIATYLQACHDLFSKELRANANSLQGINWYGRMQFDPKETLEFLHAHETMHHGEILSVIYQKNLPMPKILTDTWGFDEDH